MHRRTAFYLLAFAAGAAALSIAVAWAAIWWASPKPAEASPPAQSSQTRTVEWLYWLDDGHNRIRRSRLDGSGIVETVATSSDRIYYPRDFAVDDDNDYVYWAADNYNEIRRKRADGTGASETLVGSDISQPYGIALDDQYVYWIDYGLHTLKRVRQDGTGTVETLADSTDGLSNPYALKISPDNSYLYLYNNGARTIQQVANSGDNIVTTLVTEVSLSSWNGLAVSRDGTRVYWGQSQFVKISRSLRLPHRHHPCDPRHGHADFYPGGRDRQPRRDVCLLG